MVIGTGEWEMYLYQRARHEVRSAETQGAVEEVRRFWMVLKLV